MHYRLAPPEMAYVINDAAATLLLVGQECAEQIHPNREYPPVEFEQLYYQWQEGPLMEAELN